MDKIVIGNNILDTLVAITEEDQEKGLMNKSWPPPIMSFPFKTSKVRKFWMRNTPSPLDIVFCNNNRILDIVSGVPYSLNLIGPNKKSNLVVELPYGTCDKLGIYVSDNIELKYSVKTYAKYCVFNLKIMS